MIGKVVLWFFLYATAWLLTPVAAKSLRSPVPGSFASEFASVGDPYGVQSKILYRGGDVEVQSAQVDQVVNETTEEANFIRFQSGGPQDRRLAQVRLSIQNKCPSQIKFAIFFSTAGGLQKKGLLFLHPNEKISFAGINRQDVYLCGKAPSLGIVWQGDDTRCLRRNHCYKFQKIQLPDLKSVNEVTYTFECSSAPINRAPPRPPPIQPPRGRDGARANEWLVAHNKRRAPSHLARGKSYVPLSWSRKVAASAQKYANFLINLAGCEIGHGLDGWTQYGENLALNWNTYHQSRSPEQILKAFWEDEISLPIGRNGHYTQANWRSTTRLGCAEVSKPFRSGTCFIQVCRYENRGNCYVERYNNRGNPVFASNWRELMYSDEMC